MEETEIIYGNQLYVKTLSLNIPKYKKKERHIEREKTIKNSIEKFGVKSPLVVNLTPKGEYRIVSGCLVYEIAKELGIEELPVYIVELDEAEEKQLSVLLDQKGTIQLSPQEIVKLIGHLEYESFFGEQLSSISIDHHFNDAASSVEKAKPPIKSVIKPLNIKLPIEEKERFDKIMSTLNQKTQTDTLITLMNIYEKSI